MKVLNVGGNNKAIALPAIYAGWEHLLLDIDTRGKPDVVCDARELHTLPGSQYDAVYCSHNLEHYYRHEVPKVLAGFAHVLKPEGFAHIRVPDIGELMQVVVRKNLDIDDTIYVSLAGPITVRDVLYGYGVEIERSGQDFYAHKTGFSQKSLRNTLQRCGFPYVFSHAGKLEINALAFRAAPDPRMRELLGLPAPG